MSLRQRLRPRLAALLLVTLGLLLVSPAPRAAAASCSGVWVVVESSVRCTTSYPTGLDALRGAGFSVETIGTGYVCRVDGVPSTCTMATPYWSYWHASRNTDGSWGDWQYGTRGASVYVPTAGSAEGWSFGDGTPPAGTPPATVSTSTTRATTTSTTTRATTSTTKAATSSSTAPATSTRATTTSTPPTASTPTPVSSSPESAPAPSAPSLPSAAGAVPADPSGGAGSATTSFTGAPTAPGAGSPAGALATAGVVLLGGAGLGAMAWRGRRR